MSFGPTVRSIGIMVGPFLTDISQAWDVEAFEAHAERRYPLQRLGQPSEIVGTALYLASDSGELHNGRRPHRRRWRLRVVTVHVQETVVTPRRRRIAVPVAGG